eukprot:6159415-Pleurochrysis_carterae.AAC.1
MVPLVASMSSVVRESAVSVAEIALEAMGIKAETEAPRKGIAVAEAEKLGVVVATQAEAMA